MYSATSIVQTPLAMIPTLGYQISGVTHYCDYKPLSIVQWRDSTLYMYLAVLGERYTYLLAIA